MNNHEINQLNYCKLQIEEQLAWNASAEWKQRDYLNLIDLIQEKTGICLSLSTLKRIWKEDYSGIPHPSTLDAFAQFLDYSHWLDYKSKAVFPFPSKQNNPSKLKAKRLFVSGFFILLIVIMGVFFFQSNNSPESESGVFFNPSDVDFSCNTTVSSGVPNSVIFTYNTSKIDADSFFIQQSWDRNRRDRIKKNNTKLTSSYFYPGYHKAKLVANDSIVKEVGVRINTEGWLSLARKGYMDGNPTYIKNKDVKHNGILHVSSAHLHDNKVEINKSLMVSHFYVDDFIDVSSSNFVFETRIKCDSIANINCPVVGIVISGEGAMNYIPLTMRGCEGEAFMKLGDVRMFGKENDFTNLGCNIYDWQHLKLEVSNKVAHVYINQNKVFEIPFTEDIKLVNGFNFNFSGSGSIDFVKLYNGSGDLVFNDDF